MTNRISVSNPTQPVISVTDEGGVLVTVNYQNSTGGGGGTGDVVGPASSTDNAIARYDGTTGKLIQDSGITIADGATGTLAGSNSGDVTLGASVTDIFNLTGQVLSADDQGADRLVFWDESENKLTALTAGSGLSISGTTITATATGDVVGPASSTDNALVRFDSTTGKLVQNGQITESDTGDLAAINSLAFDTTPTGAIATQGEVMWSADDETLDIKLNGFTMHTGQHVLYHVRNSTGSTIAKGVPVMYAGTTGNSGRLLIEPWNGTGPSTLFLGLVGEDLANGASGFVVAFGKLRGIQTNGGNYGETWADGDIIYAGTTSGSLTKTQPAAPNPHIQVCSVVHAHASNGTLFVLRTLGSNIKDDEGVTITSLSSGQVLVANNAGTVFENKSVSGDAALANTGALTLATVNSNVGSFGSATAAPAVTVNAKGLVTAVSTNTITPAVGSITGLGTGVATALAVNVGSAGALVANGGALGTPSSGTLTSCTGLPISTGVSGLGTNVATSLANNMTASGTLAILGANTFTGVQTLPAGSAAAPALTFGDSNSGIYRSGSGEIGFATSGSLRYSITSAGGLLHTPTNSYLPFPTDGSFYFGGPIRARQSAGGTNTIRIDASNSTSSSQYIAWEVSGGAQLALYFDANGILAQRNGTNSQSFRIYNTFTSATNFELASIGWGSNILNIGTEKGSGGGTARAMRLVTDATARAVFEATTFNTTLLASAGSYGSGSGVLFLGNATTAPTTNPTGGGILYVEASSLKFRGESGGNNTLAILGANTFTATQTITPAANTNALAVSGYSLTGSNASALLSLDGTWNTSGTPSAIFCNITDTASNASSLLMQLQTGGTNRATITKTGFTTLGSSAITGAGTVLNLTSVYGTSTISVGGGGSFVTSGAISCGGTVFAPLLVVGADVVLQRDEAQVLALRSGTNAQASRTYNTFTSSTNFERFTVDWRTTANTCRVGTEKGSGGGTARAMNLMTDATARAVFEATTFNTTLLASAGSYGSGSGVLFLGNATTAPTTDPTGGGILYVEAGALKFRGSSGTVTTIANA